MLTPVVTSARCRLGEENGSPRGHLQCLRCGHEFKAEEPGSFQKAGKFQPCSRPPSPLQGCSWEGRNVWGLRTQLMSTGGAISMPRGNLKPFA